MDYGNILGAIGSIWSGDKNRQAQDAANRQNYDAQKEFAQMGLRWKVEDAKAAGLHPLAVLGSAGASFSPSFSAGSDNSLGAAGEYLGRFIEGQNTKRAQIATATPEEKELQQLAIERARLQNRLLEGQVQNEWAAVMGAPPQPSLPAPAASIPAGSGFLQSQPGRIEAKPSVSVSSKPGDAGVEAAQTPGFKRYAVTPRVSVELPNQQLSESLEGMGVAGHVLGPALTGLRSADKVWNGHSKPADNLLPPGYKWEWSKLRQSWSPAKVR